MSVVIRMRRTGRRNRPCYQIAVADKQFARDGRFIEKLGLYDPIAPTAEARLTLDVERARHWVSVGALPSVTVRSILRREGVYEGITPKAPRRRPGRKNKTATKTAREATKAARDAAKTGRREARAAAAREAKAAAAAAAAAASAEE